MDANTTEPMADFVCPQCGGSAFGRDTAERDGKVVAMPTVRCHSARCGWRGEWSAIKAWSRSEGCRAIDLAANAVVYFTEEEEESQ